jgi:hypothetical protein
MSYVQVAEKESMNNRQLHTVDVYVSTTATHQQQQQAYTCSLTHDMAAGEVAVAHLSGHRIHASSCEPRPAMNRSTVEAVSPPQQHLAPAAAGEQLVPRCPTLPRCSLQWIIAAVRCDYDKHDLDMLVILDGVTQADQSHIQQDLMRYQHSHTTHAAATNPKTFAGERTAPAAG